MLHDREHIASKFHAIRFHEFVDHVEYNLCLGRFFHDLFHLLRLVLLEA